MTEHRSSIVDLEEADQPMARNGHVSGDSKRDPARPDEVSQPPPTSNDKAEARQPVIKQSAKSPLTSDISEPQATLRQAFPHVYSSSRASSTRSSSSSLQALNEDIVVDARSEHGSVARSPRRASRQSDHQPEYPVYPDQSYASLQSQIHPTWQPPHLRSRSSYPTPSESLPRIHPRVTRTAGNTPVSSPGLFSMRSPRTTPPIGSDDEGWIGSPYLHPTHL